ncbi:MULTISPECIES: M20 family metallopeptidase [unclassified Micromonospora]|uniref:M20 family metallopeptidase n=1 Tax=unclassified Micromonospora TaxID=2617518 RepID=UPI0036400775
MNEDPVWLAAQDDHDSVTALTRDLVRIPSRGGIDPYGPVLGFLQRWLGERGLSARQLHGAGGDIVALVVEIAGGQPGPRYVLDACLDTAPFGDEAAWTHPPSSAVIEDGWLHGRGGADSKAAVAIFSHIGAHLRAAADQLHGSVVLLFDVDEHTGVFGGAKTYFRQAGPVDGVMIGYPGGDHIVVGGRGVLRARLHVHGVSSHSGARRPTPNAIAKAAALIQHLEAVALPGTVAGFPLSPKLTVTAVSGGEGYSVVPDLCTLNVDVRLTPAMDDRAGEALLRECVKAVDHGWPDTSPTHVEITTRWPPYALPPTVPMVNELVESAALYGLAPVLKIAGPSNIGNYLAGIGVPATAGFGVDYEGLHATNERIRLASVPPVQAVYHRTLLRLLAPR